MNSAPAKFLFDTDFSEPEVPAVPEPEVPEVPMIPLADHERQLEEVRAAALEQGRKEGRSESEETQERRLADTSVHLVGAVEEAIRQLDEAQMQVEQDAASLAFIVARRLAAHLIARSPITEMVALISECLGPLHKTPHIVIRVAEKDTEALKAKVEPLIYEKGYEGRLVVLGEADMLRGDCRIEWAEGGILRDRKAIEKQVDDHIRHYFKAKAAQRQRAQQPETTDDTGEAQS